VNPLRKVIIGGSLVAGAFAGGAAGAAMINGVAGADTSTTTPAASTPAPSTGNTTAPANGSTTAPSGPTARPSMPAHGTAEHEAQEKPVTGDAATKAQAAAVKSLGGGTAGVVTTDFTGTGYEVTVTKTDGTQVEVHLDSAFNVMQGGHGAGGPGGPHGSRPNDNDADDQPSSSTPSTPTTSA